jgi:hypothetical protein
MQNADHELFMLINDKSIKTLIEQFYLRKGKNCLLDYHNIFDNEIIFLLNSSTYQNYELIINFKNETFIIYNDSEDNIVKKSLLSYTVMKKILLYLYDLKLLRGEEVTKFTGRSPFSYFFFYEMFDEYRIKEIKEEITEFIQECDLKILYNN